MTDQILQMETTMTLDKILKESRLAANLSIDEVALKLNLKETVILDIENNLEQVIAENRYPIIYLRGYIANYSKMVGVADLKSYPEYQQLIHPEKRVTTLKSPHILRAKKSSAKKVIWILFLLILITAAGLTVFWNYSALFSMVKPGVVTENREMRLPEHSDENEPLFNDQDTLPAESTAQPVIDEQQSVETDTAQ
ncbi:MULTISPECIES: RodZ family helix-turn-helix domain-containing protein [Psychromonas]|uniref:helix-turn-helix domain-containing protein n=1 Tax=Psychromonas TaxID=67572 RepID=UPI00048C063E|nr:MULTISPECIES: helix-turn-helix domain-containing protein [Psychromonas]MBB1272937.1 helix-turn-helix domain-containing protein [Psychromonas sp. SR45-3]